MLTYYIWFEAEFIWEGQHLFLKSVRPTVRTLYVENWTVVEENDQKSSFFDSFMKN